MTEVGCRWCEDGRYRRKTGEWARCLCAAGWRRWLEDCALSRTSRTKGEP
jgi:hypothetical protein